VKTAPSIPRYTDSTLPFAPTPGSQDENNLRQLFGDYLRCYALRDDRLADSLSEDFTGFTQDGRVLIKSKDQWVNLIREEFAQSRNPLQIELTDLSIQSLANTISVATGFFDIHRPRPNPGQPQEKGRLVLIFRKEIPGWKISHSRISIPYQLVRADAFDPLKELSDRTGFLEKLVAERTSQLSTANENLRRANEELTREIAERKQTDAALLRSEQLYRSILTASPDDITITDLQGRIVMVSPTAMTMFHFPPDSSYEGRSVLEFIVPEDRNRALAHMARDRNRAENGAHEYRGLRHDGAIFDIEVNSEFIRDDRGSATGMVIIVRDITERKRKAAEREKLEAQNRRFQKAESLGRMAGAIAHHFNNKLQAVIMSLQMTLDDLPENGNHTENLTLALQSARKASELSALMLTYLGQTASKREPLDLSDICQQNLPFLRIVMPPDMELEADLPLPGPAVLADSGQIQNVLTNLLTNAWEATDGKQGAIRLAVRTVAATGIPAQRRFPVDYQLHESPYACLEVADSGSGISDQDLEKLFDPFFSRKFTGRGMGLAVVLGIARAHNWVITVDSKPGQGSIFRVFLPLLTEAVADHPVVPGHGERINR
jgi:PAS domain S-box-containing protein